MKMVLIVPVLAAVFIAGACSDNTDSPTGPETTANARFFNATSGMSSSGGFTSNGKFVTGSALAFGKASQPCSQVGAGTSSLGFGAANSGGTALSGSKLASLNNQTLVENGNYTIAATGSATKPSLFVFQNDPPHSPASTEAAVRFVNLAPGTDTVANTYVVFKGAIGGTQVGLNMAVGAPTEYQFVAAGTSQYSVLKLPGHVTAVDGTAGLLTLNTGSVNTVAIVQNSAGAYQLVIIPGC